MAFSFLKERQLETQKFSSPEEELIYLRQEIERKERELSKEHGESSVKEATKSTIDAYKKIDKRALLDEGYQISKAEEEAVALRLAPEEHDNKIEELFALMNERGVKNTLEVIARLNDPHLEDDFHRFLVQLFFEHGTIDGLKEKDPEWKGLSMVLYEVAFPSAGEQEKSFKDFIGAMEQFYVGMQSIGASIENPNDSYYSLELAQPSGTSDIVVYIAVPRTKANLLEKQLLGFYHSARIVEATNDYNVFCEGSEPALSYAYFDKDEVFPIKTYEHIDHDPIGPLLNAFSKLEKNEGAAVQILVTPSPKNRVSRLRKVLESLEKDSKSFNEALRVKGPSVARDFLKQGSFLFGGGDKKEDEGKEDKPIEKDVRAIEKVSEKLSHTLSLASIRLVASSPKEGRATEILSSIEAAFNQFEKPEANAFRFAHVLPRARQEFVHMFSYRLPMGDGDMLLNVRELASVFHFPVSEVGAPDLKEARAGSGPAPSEISEDGIAIGINTYRGVSKTIHFSDKDRLRHFYVVGQTGTGKSGTLMTMIAQDIARGEGVCYIDPHGNDIQTILSMIPKERVDDVIYFDPAYTARPAGLNMLEYDPRFPEQKTFVINELINIFNQLFDMKTAGGPLFEQYFKNSAGLVMEHPESGNTLLEIGRVLSDKAFRDMKLSHCKNPLITQFWANAEKAKGEQGLENFVPYITSKFDTFISNEIMRPVVAQEKSSFNMRDIIDNKKILLVNLSKGRLGEINANLIGLILVGKLQMAALSRADSFGKDLPPFYLYIDEFQNVTTPSISSILSEARKYKLSLTVAHQYLNQLSEEIRSAVLGNVGSMAIFRISPEDAEKLEARIKPQFSKDDIIKLENRNAYVSLLAGGQPARPFNMKTIDLPAGNREVIEPIKELSYIRYGRPRQEVEDEILRKFKLL